MIVEVPEVVDTYEEHYILVDMVRRILHQRTVTRSLRTRIQRRLRIPIQRVRIAMDLQVRQIMMMIVKMTMIHPVLVDHLDHLDQDGIVAGHLGRTIVVGHLVQVDPEEVADHLVQVEVLRVQEAPLVAQEAPLVDQDQEVQKVSRLHHPIFPLALK